jgi:hypothetical protein
MFSSAETHIKKINNEKCFFSIEWVEEAEKMAPRSGP